MKHGCRCISLVSSVKYKEKIILPNRVILNEVCKGGVTLPHVGTSNVGQTNNIIEEYVVGSWEACVVT